MSSPLETQSFQFQGNPVEILYYFPETGLLRTKDFVFKNSYVEALVPSVIIFGDGAFMEGN